jgi:hypothetical protein
MNWDETIVDKSKILSARTDAADFEELVQPLEEWLNHLLEELALLQWAYEWNRVSMELWLDSGRLIGTPALGSYEVSQWPVAVQLTIPMLATEFNEATTKDVEDQAISALEYRIWMSIRQAFRKTQVKRRLNDLRKSKVFTIWRQTGGDLSTASQFLV